MSRRNRQKTALPGTGWPSEEHIRSVNAYMRARGNDREMRRLCMEDLFSCGYLVLIGGNTRISKDLALHRTHEVHAHGETAEDAQAQLHLDFFRILDRYLVIDMKISRQMDMRCMCVAVQDPGRKDLKFLNYELSLLSGYDHAWKKRADSGIFTPATEQDVLEAPDYLLYRQNDIIRSENLVNLFVTNGP